MATSFQKKVERFYVLAGPKERYLPMFKGKEEAATPVIEWSGQTLRKDDRIVWFLKAYRKDPGIWNEENRQLLEHMMSMQDQIKAIENLKFQSSWSFDKGIEELKAAEASGMCSLQSNKRLVPEQGKKILAFGDGYAWWDLETPSSDLEAAAMGHCGNKGSPHSDDTILSLRYEKKVGKQLLYEPHLTFILNDGILGEMKGRANEKPKEKYHKYIVELLKQPLIEGIWGGGYLPMNNFEFEDLTEKEQEELEKLKPDLNLSGLGTSTPKNKAANRTKKHMRDLQVQSHYIRKLETQYKTSQLTKEHLKKELEKILSHHESAVHYDLDQLVWIIRNIKDSSVTDKFLETKKWHASILEAALSRTKNQKLIDEVAQNNVEGSTMLQMHAIQRVKDDKVLEKIFYDSETENHVKAAVVGKTKSWKIIEDAWRSKEDYQQRTALERLKEEPERLYKLLKADPEHDVPTSGTDDIIDLLSEDQLASIFEKTAPNQRWDFEKLAEKITKKDNIEKILRADKHMQQAKPLIKTGVRLKATEALKDAAMNRMNHQHFRIDALDALDDPAVVKKAWESDDTYQQSFRSTMLNRLDGKGLMALVDFYPEFNHADKARFLKRGRVLDWMGEVDYLATQLGGDKSKKDNKKKIFKLAKDTVESTPSILTLEEALKTAWDLEIDLTGKTDEMSALIWKLAKDPDRPLDHWKPLIKYLSDEEAEMLYEKAGDDNVKKLYLESFLPEK